MIYFYYPPYLPFKPKRTANCVQSSLIKRPPIIFNKFSYIFGIRQFYSYLPLSAICHFEAK